MGNNNRQWKLLCEKPQLTEAAKDPRFQTNDGRLNHREEINGIVNKRIAQRTKSEWMELLNGSGRPYGAVNEVAEALEHPQAVARDMVRMVC